MIKTTSLTGGRALAIAGWLAACSGTPASASRAIVTNTAAPGSVRVLLYGTPDFKDESRLRLQPIVCVIGGKLATAVACGEAMPATARVKIVGGATVTVERTSRDFKDEAGEQVYRAPRGPQCCMYNTCVGETIPYLAPAGTAPARDVLAIWPDDAEVRLTTYESNSGAADRSGPPSFALDQLVRAGSSALAAGRSRGNERCHSCAQLQWFDGSGWKAVNGVTGPGQDGFAVMATSDLDGDGHAEAIVREIWRNDYGLMALGNEWSKSLLRYSCGNI
jgi:hypothetical protein